MTLTEFLNGTKPSAPRNAYVEFPWFKRLYVRRTSRVLGGAPRSPVLDLANLEAKKPGQGAFTQLLKFMTTKYPRHWIYVECVLSDRFAEHLRAIGFTEQKEGNSRCFYLAPVKP